MYLLKVQQALFIACVINTFHDPFHIDDFLISISLDQGPVPVSDFLVDISGKRDRRKCVPLSHEGKASF